MARTNQKAAKNKGRVRLGCCNTYIFSVERGQAWTLFVLGIAWILAILFLLIGPSSFYEEGYGSSSHRLPYPADEWFRYRKCRLISKENIAKEPEEVRKAFGFGDEQDELVFDKSGQGRWEKKGSKKMNDNDGDSFSVYCPEIKDGEGHASSSTSYASSGSEEAADRVVDDDEGKKTKKHKQILPGQPAFAKELRLYFVDAPESLYKIYKRDRGGFVQESNSNRLESQAKYFGIQDFNAETENMRADRLRADRKHEDKRPIFYSAVDAEKPISLVGQWAKDFTTNFLTLGLGEGRKNGDKKKQSKQMEMEKGFDIFTRGERVYGDKNRIYGLVSARRSTTTSSTSRGRSKIHWLHEELAMNGLVRLGQTKGAPGYENLRTVTDTATDREEMNEGEGEHESGSGSGTRGSGTHEHDPSTSSTSTTQPRIPNLRDLETISKKEKRGGWLDSYDAGPNWLSYT
ncbi:unnamed protein product [Amoebophrya sp. A25]|nr:unnamed protein product [Amoebophrya sp. A25]|eukprot:GSA25T00001273001.1